MRIRRVALLTLIAVAAAGPAAAHIIRVNPTGSDSANGSAWPLAKRTLTAALAAASFADEIWVAAGTYTECISVPSGVALYGGFAGAETQRDQRNWNTNATVIDGGAVDAVVTFASGATSSTRMDGFVIENGAGAMTGMFYEGGGIYCASGSPVIANNIIRQNSADRGAGVCLCESHALLTGNVITANTSSYLGGGIFVESGQPTIADNEISFNSAYYDGGGLFAELSDAIISGNRINSNSGIVGAGVYVNGGFPQITRNCISENTADDSGGGLFLGGGMVAANVISDNAAATGGGGIDCDAPMSIAGNTIADNVADLAGGIRIAATVSPLIYSNIIAFNTGGVYKPIGSGKPILCGNCVYGNGIDYTNISPPTTDLWLDPLFAHRPTGDYHLAATSPCVDSSCSTRPPLTSEDVDGDPRIAGAAADIGADEFIPGSAFTTVAAAKMSPAGSRVELSAAAVTATFDGFFYIGAGDRSCGMRVEKPDHGLGSATGANVMGTTVTSANGEYCIFADSVAAAAADALEPLGVSHRNLGGGSLGQQQAVWEWSHSLDRMAPMGGPNNIGLLMRIWGRITERGSGFVRLDDGSGVSVKCVLPAGVIVDPAWDYVAITGISSCEKQGEQLRRVLLVRRSGDVAPL